MKFRPQNLPQPKKQGTKNDGSALPENSSSQGFMVSKISLFPVLTAKIRMHSNELGQNEQLNQSIIIRLNEGFVPINIALFII